MKRPLRLTACLAAAALAFSATSAMATIEGMSSGVTVDAGLEVTGLTVPNGKVFSTLATANVADSDISDDCCAQAGFNRSGEAHFTSTIPVNGPGTANNLNINVPSGFFVIANGFGYTDLREFGGNEFIQAADGGDSSQQDFVLSDLGGNDSFAIQAILVNNQLGERIFINSDVWGHIQFQDPNGADFGQRHGFIAFDISDLKDENGNNLNADAAIRGVRVYENQDPLPLTSVNQRLDLVFVAGDVVAAVPEPTTMLLAGIPLLGLLARRNRVR